jgi:predicted HicB family RNase H-like nuclease
VIAELPPPVRHSAQMTLHLPEDEWVALVHEARAQRISLAALVRNILRERRRRQLLEEQEAANTTPSS